MKWNVTADLNEAIEQTPTEDIALLGETILLKSDGLKNGKLKQLYREIGFWLQEIGNVKDET